MQIKIVEVGSPELKQGPKAKYSTFKLSYAVDGKLRDRKIMSFDKDVYAALKAASPGEMYDVEVVKDGEFWNWKAVSKAGSSAPEAGAGKYPASTGFSRETPEEKAAREIRIVKQSTLGYAVTALGAGHTDSEYFDMAKRFEQYVWDMPVLETEATVE